MGWGLCHLSERPSPSALPVPARLLRLRQFLLLDAVSLHREDGRWGGSWPAAPTKRGQMSSTRGADPGAGQEPAGDSRDSEGPVLQFDYEAVANRLFEMASRESTPSLNRKRLYKVVRKLQDLAGGIFPEDDVPEEAYRKLLEGKRERKRKKQQRRQPRSPLQQQKGKEAAASDPDPSPRVGRKRSRRKGRGAEPTVRRGGRPGRVGGAASREQPSGPRQGGAHKRRRPRQAAGAGAQVASVQEPKKKKKRTLASGE